MEAYKLEKFQNLMLEFQDYTAQFFPEFTKCNPKQQEKVLKLKNELEKNKSIVQYQIVDDSSLECVSQIEDIKRGDVDKEDVRTVLENSLNILNFNNKILQSNLKAIERMNMLHWEINSKIEEFNQVIEKINLTKTEENANPKLIIPPLHNKIIEIQNLIIKILQSKFIFKNEKQIETNQEGDIKLKTEFFNGSSKSLLNEIIKLGKKMKKEIKTLKEENEKREIEKSLYKSKNLFKFFKNLIFKEDFFHLEDQLFGITILIIESILENFGNALESYKKIYRSAETFLSVNFIKSFVLKHHKKQANRYFRQVEEKHKDDSFLEFFDKCYNLKKEITSELIFVDQLKTLILANNHETRNFFLQKYSRELVISVKEVELVSRKLQNLIEILMIMDDLPKIEKERLTMINDLDSEIRNNEDTFRVTERSERGKLMRNLFARFSNALIFHSQLHRRAKEVQKLMRELNIMTKNVDDYVLFLEESMITWKNNQRKLLKKLREAGPSFVKESDLDFMPYGNHSGKKERKRDNNEDSFQDKFSHLLTRSQKKNLDVVGEEEIEEENMKETSENFRRRDDNSRSSPTLNRARAEKKIIGKQFSLDFINDEKFQISKERNVIKPLFYDNSPVPRTPDSRLDKKGDTLHQPDVNKFNSNDSFRIRINRVENNENTNPQFFKLDHDDDRNYDSNYLNIPQSNNKGKNSSDSNENSRKNSQKRVFFENEGMIISSPQEQIRQRELEIERERELQFQIQIERDRENERLKRLQMQREAELENERMRLKQLEIDRHVEFRQRREEELEKEKRKTRELEKMRDIQRQENLRMLKEKERELENIANYRKSENYGLELVPDRKKEVIEQSNQKKNYIQNPKYYNKKASDFKFKSQFDHSNTLDFKTSGNQFYNPYKNTQPKKKELLNTFPLGSSKTAKNFHDTEIIDPSVKQDQNLKDVSMFSPDYFDKEKDDNFDLNDFDWNTQHIQPEEAYRLDRTKVMHLFLKRKINDTIPQKIRTNFNALLIYSNSYNDVDFEVFGEFLVKYKKCFSGTGLAGKSMVKKFKEDSRKSIKTLEFHIDMMERVDQANISEDSKKYFLGRKDAERRFKYMLGLMSSCLSAARKIEEEIEELKNPMFNFGNFNLYSSIKEFLDLSSEMLKIAAESQTIARNPPEETYADHLSKMAQKANQVNMLYIGFSSKEETVEFMKICDMISKVNSGHQRLFASLWKSLEQSEERVAYVQIIEVMNIYKNSLRKEAKRAHKYASSAKPPRKFHEIDVEELDRMLEMIEENSVVFAQLEDGIEQVRELTKESEKKRKRVQILEFLEEEVLQEGNPHIKQWCEKFIVKILKV